MRPKQFVLAVALVPLLALAAFPQRVTVDHDRAVSFSSFQTYAWKLGTPTENSLMDDRIIKAIDYQMATKGIVKVDAESTPDLFVTFHTAVTYETQIYTTSSGWDYYFGGTYTTYIDKIPVASLVVEMGDPQTKKLVWRSEGSSTVSEKPQKIEKKIYQIVEKMFRKFPPEAR